jgi:hypothetical protein
MSALNGATLPLVIWGNGACANSGNSFSNFLTDISVVWFRRDRPRSHNRAQRRRTSATRRTGSKYYKHLNSAKIAVMGQSCGGVQAIEIAADPRITTAVVWNSGLFAQPSDMGGGGDPTDIAHNNANSDFEYIKSIPIFRAWERGVGQGGMYNQPNGGEFAGIGVAWLNWQLKGDQRAALMFRGPDCGLCVNPRWVVQTKNFK